MSTEINNVSVVKIEVMIELSGIDKSIVDERLTLLEKNSDSLMSWDEMKLKIKCLN